MCLLISSALIVLVLGTLDPSFLPEEIATQQGRVWDEEAKDQDTHRCSHWPPMAWLPETCLIFVWYSGLSCTGTLKNCWFLSSEKPKSVESWSLCPLQPLLMVPWLLPVFTGLEASPLSPPSRVQAVAAVGSLPVGPRVLTPLVSGNLVACPVTGTVLILSKTKP